MFLHITVFCGPKRVGIYMSLQPGGRFLLRCGTVQTLSDFIGEQNPLANALSRTSKIVEEFVEVVENTKRFDCTATLGHLAV